MTITRSSAAL